MTTPNHYHEHDAGSPAPAAAGWADSDEFATPTPASDLEVFSTRDVARLFGRTERTIRNWVRAGRLRRGGFGRSVFFSREAIDALLRGETGRPRPGPDTSSP